MISFADISEEITDRPAIDYMADDHFVTQAQRQWITEGVAVFPAVLDPDLIEAYCYLRENLALPGGWPDATPYMRHREIRDLGCSEAVFSAIREIMGGQEYGMHLNLTGWISTERNWHQDDYLNPPFIRCNYVAAWLALDDIHPDSGPFHYVPGSHRWPVIRQDKMRAVYGSTMNDPHWPKITEPDVAKCCEEEISRRGAPVVTYLPRKGDLLLWHGALMHRGSAPRVPGMLRKSLIIHYSALDHRHDMPRRQEYGAGNIFLLNGEPS